MRENNNSFGFTALSFIAGAVVGAVVVALSSPKSGPEMRDSLKGMARRTRWKADEMKSQASEAFEDIRDRVSVAATDIKEGAFQAYHDLKHS